MKDNEKELLVKELYEKYPYPLRKVKNSEQILSYVDWLSNIFSANRSFWKNKSILEFGCGTGELANALALCDAKVDAIDFSSASIKEAQKLSKRFSNKKKVSFSEQNILSFSSIKNKKTEKYDVVIALGSLHHTINARKGFEIMCEHCKDNGLVIIGLYNKYSRARHRIKRIILWILAGKNIEARIKIGKKLFSIKENSSRLADKYGQVHESYHSVREVLQWFREEKIVFVGSKPKFVFPVIDEIKWLFKKQNAFFVMIGKKS